MNDFKGRPFRGEIVLWAVRWYCRYRRSATAISRAMMTERGVAVDRSTIYRRVQRFVPEMEKRLRWQWRRPQSRSWRIDETYVKVRGKRAYLYRAVDKLGKYDRFLSLGDPQHQGSEAISRQGAERIEGVGTARGCSTPTWRRPMPQPSRSSRPRGNAQRTRGTGR